MIRKSPSPLFLIVLTIAIIFIAWYFTALTKNYQDHAISKGKSVIGFITPGEKQAGMATISNNPGVFTEVSPDWYTINSQGGLIGQDQQTILKITTYLRAKHIKIIPTISNFSGDDFDPSIVHSIFVNSNKLSSHINAIVRLVTSQNYDGIDIDYESMYAKDRTAFTAFITRLASSLHAQRKILSVDLHPKTSEPGDWSGPQAEDYRALGKIVDEARIMTYDYSSNTSPPGPIAPAWWVADVISFSITQIPASKVVQGTPLYGYDWIGNNGDSKTWKQITAILASTNSKIAWDDQSKSPHFSYTENGQEHSVWYSNAESTDPLLDIVNKHQLGGIAFWRLGGEDVNTWAKVRSKIVNAQ